MTEQEKNKVLVFEYITGLLALAYTDKGESAGISIRLQNILSDAEKVSKSCDKFDQGKNDFGRVKAMDLFHAVITHGIVSLNDDAYIHFAEQFAFEDTAGSKNLERTIYGYFNAQFSLVPARNYVQIFNGYARLLPDIKGLLMREGDFANDENLTQANRAVLDWLSHDSGANVQMLRQSLLRFQAPPPIKLNYLIHDID